VGVRVRSWRHLFQIIGRRRLVGTFDEATESAAIDLVKVLLDEPVKTSAVNLVEVLLDEPVESTAVDFVKVPLLAAEGYTTAENMIILYPVNTLDFTYTHSARGGQKTSMFESLIHRRKYRCFSRKSDVSPTSMFDKFFPSLLLPLKSQKPQIFTIANYVSLCLIMFKT